MQFSSFPDRFPEIDQWLQSMRTKANKTLSAHRRRLKRKGVARVEVNVRKDDAVLVRGVAKALNDPAQRPEVRSLLQQRFGDARSRGLQALLAAAPLEGVDLSRDHDFGRDVKL